MQVTVNGDNTGEANETFRLIATPAGGTAILGVATIRNDVARIALRGARVVPPARAGHIPATPERGIGAAQLADVLGQLSGPPVFAASK